MEELLKCPFCGGEAEIIKVHGQKIDTRVMPYRVPLAVICTNTDCGAHMGNWYDRLDAIAAWNRRAAPENKRMENCHIYEPGENIGTIAGKCDVLIKGADLWQLTTAPENTSEVVKKLWALYDKYEDAEHVVCGDAAKLLTAAPENKPPCYSAEKDNPYPLCTGRGMTACTHCCLWADYKPEQDESRVNKPLTSEEIRQRVEKPVWISEIDQYGIIGRLEIGQDSGGKPRYRYVIGFSRSWEWLEDVLSGSRKAYARKPEGSEK